ncbi:MAG: GntR family transcriptional regulator [Deltaproteobacteria bacterium]|nr:GntR family transcriptional regulator [Deltaproteobacteria bacterium]
MTISATIQKTGPLYQTMTEIAAHLIRERVLTGQYKSGTRLIPEKMEAELGLGRVAIREALRELTGSGLVVSLPNKGVVVADPPEPDEIKALYQARYALEGEAAFQATQRITPDVIGQLEETAARMEALAAQIEATPITAPFDFTLLNREFHLTLYEASGWKPVCRIINQLFDQTLIFRAQNTAWIDIENVDYYNLEHRGIIEALRSGDAQKVRQRVVANISRGFKQYALNQPFLKYKPNKAKR